MYKWEIITLKYANLSYYSATPLQSAQGQMIKNEKNPDNFKF